MKKPIILRSKPTQNDNLVTDQKKPCHLRLVVSNPDPTPKKQKLKARNPNAVFTAEIQERGHPHYTLVAYDSFHHLECEVNLEIHSNEEEGELEDGTVVCYFSNIATEDLDELIEEDETLHGMILMQFQLKILEQILLFCNEHTNALSVFVEAENRPEDHILAIYEELAIHKDKVPTATGTKTQMLIPATPKTFEKLIDFIEDINQDFRQTLWEDKGSNPAIWNYLKLTHCLKLFD